MNIRDELVEQRDSICKELEKIEIEAEKFEVINVNKVMTSYNDYKFWI